MTKYNKRPYIAFAFLIAFLCYNLQAFSQQKIARTVSPSMVIRILSFQNVTPDDLHNLQRLYESTGWKILKMDDDPSDGAMAVWGGRNMELDFDGFSVSGTDKPNNGIYIHLSKTDGFKVDFIKIVFNDENEEELFKAQLPSYGITQDGSNYSGDLVLNNGQKIGVDCEFGFESMNPKVEINIKRE